MKTRNEPHNGWRNYETWLANLWLRNSAAETKRWEACAIGLVEGGDAQQQQHGAALTAQIERYYVVEKWPLPEDSGLYSDFLASALANVNWAEIAQHFLDDAAEILSSENQRPTSNPME